MTAEAASKAAPESVLSLRDAAVTLGSRRLWSHVNLELATGEFVALLGPNGAGKTTLVKAVLGSVPLSEGSVLLLGRPPGHENDRVGYLPQRRMFDARVRIRGVDLVRLGLDGDRWGVPLPGAGRFSARGRRREARVREVIDLVGASAYAERPIGLVSGGEQQRLLIAQSLVREPALLLLDEPLDGLDLPSQASVTALIGRVCREQGIAVLMVAHDVNPLVPYLDRVAYIGGGGVVTGTANEVVTSQTLSRVYGTPIEVVRTADGWPAVLGQPEAGVSCHGGASGHGAVHAH